MPAFAGTVTLRYARARAVARPAPEWDGVTGMHLRRNQLTIAAVAFVLGLLVVVQLRTQAERARPSRACRRRT